MAIHLKPETIEQIKSDLETIHPLWFVLLTDLRPYYGNGDYTAGGFGDNPPWDWMWEANLSLLILAAEEELGDYL